MAHNVEIEVKWLGDGYYVITRVDQKRRCKIGPFPTIEAAKAAADDLGTMLAAVNS